MSTYEWTCPYCNRDQLINNESRTTGVLDHLNEKSNRGLLRLVVRTVACANPKCKGLTLGVTLSNRTYNPHGPDTTGAQIQAWTLLPESAAIVLPDYIPAQLRQDYVEACRIVALSPKASATLSRRCLQGIIRDFGGIKVKGNRLVDEIRELRRLVDSGQAPKGVSIDSVDAIDKVRAIGNIGAHMEDDINKIIDIDPDEASILTQLLENLFAEWYVERQKRNERFAKIGSIAEAKHAARKGPAVEREKVEKPGLE